MKKLFKSGCVVLVFLMMAMAGSKVNGQVGVNYFFPEKGTFSIPLAPLSYSQPIMFGKFRYFKLIPGGSVYSMGGMSVTGLPSDFPNSKPLVGQFYSVLVSVMPALSIPVGMFDLDFCAGYFGAYNIQPKVLQGNMDEMLMAYEGWDACTSEVDFKNRINHGYVFGMSVSIWFNDKQAVAPGVFYYMGGSKLGMNGSYTGGKLGLPVESKAIDFPESRLNYRGFEVQVAVQL